MGDALLRADVLLSRRNLSVSLWTAAFTSATDAVSVDAWGVAYCIGVHHHWNGMEFSDSVRLLRSYLGSWGIDGGHGGCSPFTDEMAGGYGCTHDCWTRLAGSHEASAIWSTGMAMDYSACSRKHRIATPRSTIRAFSAGASSGSDGNR